MHGASLESALAPIVIMLVIVAGGTLVESAIPAEPKQLARHTLFNVAYGVMLGWMRLALAPVVGVGITLIFNHLGSGWIALPAHGWLLIASALVYVAVIDFLEFAFHRAQHAVPFLWAMHSFHHSDPAVNISTATRNYWLELPIKALFVYPVAAILFSVPPVVLAIYSGTTIWHSVNHLNVRWRSPIPWFVLNNPQFHRLHHSIRPEHYNRNFSPYFPIWDLLCGTYYVPKPGEYPPTGLPDEREPITFAEAILWPWRYRLRSARALQTSAGN